jgi:Uma2 family endonuclease
VSVATSKPFDCGRKLPLYARNGIAELWIVNVAAGHVEVHRQPEGEDFRERAILTPGERIASAVLRQPVAVVDLLP